MKRSGKAAIPSGDASIAFEKIDFILKDAGIYVVPVGELERFVPKVGDHGPGWVSAVIEQYPDFGSEVYEEARKFVSGIDV